ncbi:hypothetical protein [Aureimonas sp. AU40]|uniref:hypothetical protein n=1 Tax=Aureimonas sp. AU40 TaxID=1637747 RepID=UPI0007801EC8|nr:hypothetical protein [Aureimonas sp. AU40]
MTFVKSNETLVETYYDEDFKREVRRVWPTGVERSVSEILKGRHENSVRFFIAEDGFQRDVTDRLALAWCDINLSHENVHVPGPEFVAMSPALDHALFELFTDRRLRGENQAEMVRDLARDECAFLAA